MRVRTSIKTPISTNTDPKVLLDVDVVRPNGFPGPRAILLEKHTALVGTVIEELQVVASKAICDYPSRSCRG